ncbi:MAG: primosomal protein N', partial [Planctomycetota bacterium]
MVAPLPFARVALAIPVPQLFDYEVPRGLEEEVVPGARVRVPFGSGVRIGYCVERTGQARHSKPRSIEAVLDEAPLIEPGLLRLMRWAAEYYISSIGDVIESAIPRRVREGRVRRIRWVGLIEVDGPAQRGAGKEARERILGLLKERGAAIPIGELLATAAVGESPVKTLERQGRVEIFRAPSPGAGGPVARGTPRRTAVKSDPGFALTPEQERSVRRMVPAIRRPAFQAFLLHGVTGSGKTEVYLQSIHAALEEGRGALVLLPEISLTPQTVKRFRERVGEVAVLHSLLGAGERAHEYWRLRARKARVAIGARSAVFAPVPDLGLIVVDECHESSYKQESSPRYHARDVAVMRASQLGIPCLLGTATPSLESLENARRERYTLLRLPSRVTSQSLATIEIIDRRREIPGRNHRTGILSPRLADLVRETVARDEQVMLFLNRRGFARNIHCPRCGFALRCDECDIGLTYHRRKDRSQCHYCGGVHSLPRSCPDCSFPGMRRSRPGTERIEECLGRLLPGVPVARLDRDTATSSSRMEEILEGFRRGQTRVLVGTQMIAKGHDIPGVTLVGVVDADVALNLPD